MTAGGAHYRAMFQSLAGRGEGAFGAFVMLGDPDIETSAAILEALAEGGADMLELGIPFSDPVADGPTIQAAAERALARGVTPADCMALVERFRGRHPCVPVGLLTYANIVLARGRDAFYRACATAGVDSVLVADAPAFEAEPFVASARQFGIAPVLIVAAATPRHTLRRIAELGEGYAYCVTRPGVTGAETAMRLDHSVLFAELDALAAPPPVLGFGIATPADVRQGLRAGAAGVISGSAIVKLVEAGGDRATAVRRFVADMKAACRHGENVYLSA